MSATNSTLADAWCADTWVTVPFHTLKAFIWTSTVQAYFIFPYQLSKSSTRCCSANVLVTLPLDWGQWGQQNGWTHSWQYKGHDPEVTCQRVKLISKLFSCWQWRHFHRTQIRDVRHWNIFQKHRASSGRRGRSDIEHFRVLGETTRCTVKF